jgi:hypothetical protein
MDISSDVSLSYQPDYHPAKNWLMGDAYDVLAALDFDPSDHESPGADGDSIFSLPEPNGTMRFKLGETPEVEADLVGKVVALLTEGNEIVAYSWDPENLLEDDDE